MRAMTGETEVGSAQTLDVGCDGVDFLVRQQCGDVAHHPFDGQIDALVAGILDNAPILPDLDDAVKTHEVIFAADKSAATGLPIKLPLDS